MPYLTRDGVKLYYEEAGSGPPMIFIHGWTCDRSHFAPQAAHFAPHYRCLSVDLRGHGESDKPEQEYTIDGFAADVAWMCGELGVSGAVLAGHSMGGAIGLAVAAAHPELCKALVMLDPAILFPAELLPLITQLVAGFRSPEGAAVLRQFGSDQFFVATSDPKLKAQIVDGMMRTPMHVVASAFEGVTAFDGDAALGAVKMPVLYVGADPQIAQIARLAELCPQAITAKTAVSGHFHQLEVPAQVNAMMDRFLAAAVPA